MTDLPEGTEKNIADQTTPKTGSTPVSSPAEPSVVNDSAPSADEQRIIESNDRWLFQVEEHLTKRWVRRGAYEKTLHEIAHQAAVDTVRLADTHGAPDAYAAMLIHTMRKKGTLLHEPVTPGLDPVLIGGIGLAVVQLFAAAAGGVSTLLGIGPAHVHVIPVLVLFVTLYTMMRTALEAENVKELHLGSIAIPYLPVLCFVAAAAASVVGGLQGVVLSSWVWLISSGATLALALTGGGLCKLVDYRAKYRGDWFWRLAAGWALRARGFIQPDAVDTCIRFLEEHHRHTASSKTDGAGEFRRDRSAALVKRFGKPADAVGTYVAVKRGYMDGGPPDLSADQEERGNKLSSHMLLSFALTTIACAWYETRHAHLVMTGLYGILLVSLMIVGVRQGSKAD